MFNSLYYVLYSTKNARSLIDRNDYLKEGESILYMDPKTLLKPPKKPKQPKKSLQNKFAFLRLLRIK